MTKSEKVKESAIDAEKAINSVTVNPATTTKKAPTTKAAPFNINNLLVPKVEVLPGMDKETLQQALTFYNVDQIKSAVDIRKGNALVGTILFQAKEHFGKDTKKYGAWRKIAFARMNSNDVAKYPIFSAHYQDIEAWTQENSPNVTSPSRLVLGYQKSLCTDTEKVSLKANGSKDVTKISKPEVDTTKDDDNKDRHSSVNMVLQSINQFKIAFTSGKILEAEAMEAIQACEDLIEFTATGTYKDAESSNQDAGAIAIAKSLSQV